VRDGLSEDVQNDRFQERPRLLDPLNLTFHLLPSMGKPIARRPRE
jgi:hypothetical protein